jgi:hypothetical protein
VHKLKLLLAINARFVLQCHIHMEPESPKKTSVVKKIILPLIIFLIVFIGAGASYYFYQKYQTSQKLLNDPTAAQAAEVKSVTAEVGKLMDLPTGETPSVATVLDKTQVTSQAFFAKAENGDKVLVYSKAGIAILYRPSTNRIINVAPVNLNTSAATIKVAIYNGSGIAGLTTKFAGDIVKIATNLTITNEANAARSDYARSVVVDLSGTKADLATQMATLIGGDVSALPAGEVRPTDATSDLLVILGRNYTTPVVAAPAASPAATPAASPSATPIATP